MKMDKEPLKPAQLKPEDILKGRELPASMTPKRKRPIGVLVSFVLLAVLPGLLAIYYFAAVASDRYAAGAGFSVRSMEQQGGLDVLGGLTGMAASGSTMADTYVVISFLTSRSLVEKLEADVGLRALYASDLADPIYRIDPAISIEGLVDHWERRITVNHDTSSGIVEFEIDAYTAEDAKVLADRVLFYVAQLVNELSEKARGDALFSARNEAERAEEKLAELMLKLQSFRSTNGDIDPASTAGAHVELIAALEGELASVNARIDVALRDMNENAPSVLRLKSQADALQAQIDARNNLNSGALDIRSRVLSEYETLQVEKTFAQQAYASAMTSLETARMNADARQRYLATFDAPFLPQEAIYPQRVMNSILFCIGFMVLWAISTLLFFTVRDHVQ